jgi:hypothetical protein
MDLFDSTRLMPSGDIGPAAKETIPAHQQAFETRRVDAAARAAILKIEGKPVPTYH